MVPKTTPLGLAAVPLCLVMFCGDALFHQISASSAESPDRVQQQPARVDSTPADSRLLKLTPHQIVFSKTRKFNLNLPPGFEITVAAQGLKRARFMAKSPDNRIFVTDMFNRTDNQKGAVYVLDGFDAAGGKFNKVTAYLKGLRNPNSIAFYTDQNGDHWFYLALTDRLLRYRYVSGEATPSSEPDVIAKFPDYGLNYKYGGGISRARSLSAADASTSRWAAAVMPAKKRSRSERQCSRWTWTARIKEYSQAVCATRLG